VRVIQETRRAHSISKGHNTTEKTDMNDPKCQWSAPYEDSIHYLMECPLYQNNIIVKIDFVQLLQEITWQDNFFYNSVII
jgi:hypothetical protein